MDDIFRQSAEDLLQTFRSQKLVPGMPLHQADNESCRFIADFILSPIAEDDVTFGHKVFRLPTFGFEYLRLWDKAISPKLRILISYFLIYASILCLVLDNFIDIKFLSDLSVETLMDVKYIHFDEKVNEALV